MASMHIVCILYVSCWYTVCCEAINLCFGTTLAIEGLGVRSVKEARKPQMDLRVSCDVGGRPGSLFVSPDGAQLFVFDREGSQVSAVSVSRWVQLERIDLVRPGS